MALRQLDLDEPHQQIDLIGLDEARRIALTNPNKSTRARMLRRVEDAHDLLSEMPALEDVAFAHSALCQVFLPHKRPADNHTPWRRQSGRATLWVRPGLMRERRGDKDDALNDYVGVPFGPKARLIMIFMQSEVRKRKTREIFLGKNLSSFMRALELPNTGGPRGAIVQVKEQFKRIVRSSFTIQFDGDDTVSISDTNLVEGLHMSNLSSEDWTATIQLSQSFFNHLMKHAVPLDRRGIAHLSNNSLGLDLYALFAHRLPRLNRELRLSWEKLQEQIGSEYKQPRDLSRAVRTVLPEVKIAYPHANVEVGKGGLVLRPSKEVVPKTMVQGFTLN
jgi:Plasmid encoded RepA protein